MKNLSVEKKLTAMNAGSYVSCGDKSHCSYCEAEAQYAPCAAAHFELYDDVVKAFMDYMDSHKDLSNMSGWYAENKDLVEYKDASLERRAELRKKYNF